MLLPSLSRECGGHMANSTVKATPEGFVVVDVIIPLASAIDDVNGGVGGGQCRGASLEATLVYSSPYEPCGCVPPLSLTVQGMRFRTP